MSPMSSDTPREVEHHIDVDAPADDIVTLLADVRHWPRIFPPTIHVEYAEKSGSSERIRIWATANDEVKTWTSYREIDEPGRRIDFRQEVSQPPVASMAGAWLIEPRSGGTSRVRLLHTYRAIDDDPERLAWLDRAVDTNSRTELAALKKNLELATGGSEELTFSFEDSIEFAGAARDAYDFINEANLWKDRLPHVDRVVFTEDSPGLQMLEMDTRTKDGSTHTTKSARICFPHDRIVYKQMIVPALMTMHTGRWQLFDAVNGDPAKAVSQHTVTINGANIEKILGPGAGVPDALAFVRNALGRNSMATLKHAKRYAKSRA
jgi:aromatase